MDPADQINELLRESLAEQGVALELRDGWLANDDTGPALRGAVKVETEEEGARVQLNVYVALPDGRVAIESHAAARLTADEALVSAYGKFATNSLPAIVSAFFTPEASPEARPNPWSIGETKWDVHLGSIGLEIFPTSEATQFDPSAPPVAPPAGLPDLVHKLVCARESDLAPTSWVRVFFAFADGEPVAQEALWNGQLWPVAQQALSELAWPTYEGFYALRFFLIAKQHDAGAPAWPLDHRSTSKVVQRFVALAEQDPKATEDDLCELLIDEGVDYVVAEAVAQFTPIGFAYLMFSQLDLSPRYHIADQAGEVIATRMLTSEPAFLAAREVARALEAVSRPIVATLAARAAIFQAIEDAVQRGRSVPDLEVVMRADESEIAKMADASRAAEALEAAEASQDVEVSEVDAPRKAWWQFWD